LESELDGADADAVKDAEQDLHFKPTRLLSAAFAAMVGALVMANIYLFLAHTVTTCVVWTSLIFTPVFIMLCGVTSLAAGVLGDSTNVASIITGSIFIALGMIQLVCLFCCWKRLIPFTVKLTEVVSDVISRNRCLLVVPIIGALASMIWSAACVVAMLGFAVKHKVFTQTPAPQTSGGQSDADVDVDAMPAGILFVYFLVFCWGAGVAYNVCHVTNCGVFARWYYHGLVGDSDSESGSSDSEGMGRVSRPIGPSLYAALTTSLGSVCCGSFLVAAVRALEALARQAESDAAGNGNIVMCLCMCAVQCLLACIGDMLEYFNEWAYVQCAVRGTNFCQSAKITYALMTCANLRYVIADLLLDSVISMGGLLCGLVAAFCGAITEYALGGGEKWIVGAVMGLILGVPIGMSSLSSISSGAKTILACWADDPEPLQVSHPEIAEEFEQRIRTGIAKGPPRRRRR